MLRGQVTGIGNVYANTEVKGDNKTEGRKALNMLLIYCSTG